MLDIGVTTDTGPACSVNEDRARVDAELGLFVVADGMGGHEAGEVASVVAVDTLFEYVLQAREDGDPPHPKVLREAVAAANQLVIEKAAEREGRKGMGTTLTALWLLGREYWIGHVGDTRAWRARDGSVDQITRDHSLVSERVRRGVMSPAEAETHPMRNVLTRSLGNRPQVEVDLYRGEVLAGDLFVLASDGLVKACDADRIERLLGKVEGAQAASSTLVGYACEHDGTDNVTVVVVRCSAAAETGVNLVPVPLDTSKNAH